MTTESIERNALVRDTESWLGTRFEHGQLVKNVAADCSTFLAECFRQAGIFRADIPHLPADWFLHTTKEEYLEELQKHALEYATTNHELEELKQRAAKDGTDFDAEIRQPLPGDVVIVKDTAIGAKVFSHGCIVVAWPIVIHCFPPCVMKSNVRSYPAFQGRKLRYFNPWKKPAV